MNFHQTFLLALIGVAGIILVQSEMQKHRDRVEAEAIDAHCAAFRATLPNDGMSDDDRVAKILAETGVLKDGCWTLTRPIHVTHNMSIINNQIRRMPFAGADFESDTP